MAWRSSKPFLTQKRRLPKRKAHQGQSGLGLPEKLRVPMPIEEIRRLGQGMVLASRAFAQGARSSQRRSVSGAAASEGTGDASRPARRGATR